MKYLITILCLCVGCTAYAQNIWTVSNEIGFEADYTNIQDAHDAASAGDIIMVQGSDVTYPAVTITKQLTIIGGGYADDEHPDYQTNSKETSMISVTFNSGSENSIIKNCRAGGSYINVDFIIVESCYISSLTINAINTQIFKSIFTSTIQTNASNNSIISNCAFLGNNTNVFRVDGFEVYNSVFLSWLGGSTENTNFTNCIFMNANFSYDADDDNTYFHCIFANQTPISGVGNQFNISPTTVFDYDNIVGSINYGYELILKSNSPAIGTGYGGIDCGIFGGATPYAIFGITGIPTVDEVITPGTVSGNMNVTVKAKSNQ